MDERYEYTCTIWIILMRYIFAILKNNKPVKHVLAMTNKLLLSNDASRKLTLIIENIQFHKICMSGIQFFLLPFDQRSSFFFQEYASRFSAVT